MILKKLLLITQLATTFSVLLLTACSTNSNTEDNFAGLKVKLLVGSALGNFCNQAAKNFNATQPKNALAIKNY